MAATTTDYRIFCNAHPDAGFTFGDRAAPYEPGDPLFGGEMFTIDVDPAGTADAVAERVFMRHNQDNRPDGRDAPSMSTGDVVVFYDLEVTMAVAGCGWVRVSIDPDDVRTVPDGQRMADALFDAKVAGREAERAQS